MKIYVLLGLALVCAAAGDLTRSIRDITEAEESSTASSGDLFVLDENGKLVRLDLNATHPEPISEVAKDLFNRVFFFLHTRKSLWIPQRLNVDDVDSIKNSNFDPTKETKFVTHGWKNSHLSAACVMVWNAFLEHGDYNVIVIDWGLIAAMPYLTAAQLVPDVAKYTSKMMDFLHTQGMQPSKVTVVGHSLGAHVAGLSSYYAKNKVDYVVGLDPAQPLFVTAGPGSRVSRGDGNHVEIIHTNAGNLGYRLAIGDVDFFPNGGSKQLGCVNDPGGSCSHARSFMYFAESINTRIGFIARKCNNYFDYKLARCITNDSQRMGGIVPKHGVSGTYYLDTNPFFPFAKGWLL